MSGKAKEIYDCIRKKGTVSKQDLVDVSRITGSTVTRLLEELLSQELIREVGLGDSTGGRKPILYRINPLYAYAFGLEISRIHCRLVLCDLQMDKLESRSWNMTESMTPEVLTETVGREAEDMLEKLGLAWSSVLGLGIGSVGPVDRQRGIILEPLYFPAPGWRNVDIGTALSRRLGIPVWLDNGANTALLGEFWADSFQSYRHMLYLHAGVGIRSAMMSNGHLVYGAVDMEGAVGQMIIQTDGLPHREKQGNYGALESYASLYAMERNMRSALKQGRESTVRSRVSDPEEVKYPDLLQGLAERDPLTVELFTQAAVQFGIGLSNLLNILHPEKVILGGPLIAGNDLFFRVATQTAVRKTYYYPEYQVMFSRGKLGDDALAAGAAVMVLERLLEA
ncbi:ROK family protein [Paenibacillus aurantius]|uniref:ROK family protein n=1 Tax=Paenibacillus aurantius TaxID=2918900 RepID=UPI00387F998B